MSISQQLLLHLHDGTLVARKGFYKLWNISIWNSSPPITTLWYCCICELINWFICLRLRGWDFFLFFLAFFFFFFFFFLVVLERDLAWKEWEQRQSITGQLLSDEDSSNCTRYMPINASSTCRHSPGQLSRLIQFYINYSTSTAALLIFLLPKPIDRQTLPHNKTSFFDKMLLKRANDQYYRISSNEKNFKKKINYKSFRHIKFMKKFLQKFIQS